jgi:hypothetical protein
MPYQNLAHRASILCVISNTSQSAVSLFIMRATDETSTVGGEFSSQEYTAEERIAFLKGTLEAQQAFFREQIAELKSTAAKLEEENLTFTVKMEQVAAHVKEEFAKQAGVNKVILETAITDERAIDVPVLRSGPIVWTSSASSISTGRDPRMIDVLDFPGAGAQVGISTWKIKILGNDGVRLGVVSSLEKKYEVPLGESDKSWSYANTGYTCHNNCRVGGWHVGFTTGSIVTLSLDLMGRGTLSLSVDDKPLIRVFDGMKKGNEQFIPAAFLHKQSSIEFLGFQFNPKTNGSFMRSAGLLLTNIAVRASR